MRNATALWAVLAAALAPVAAGCGGSNGSPQSPPSWDSRAPSSAGDTSPSAVLEPRTDEAPSQPPEHGGAPATADASLPVKKLAPGSVPAPRPEQPSRGPLGAPVVIQVFSDFECPYCAGTKPVLAQLEREFGAQIRIVWRALPLPGHALARESATAALEAYGRRGGAAFWRVHDRLFAEAGDGLTMAEIEDTLRGEGVSVEQYRAALQSGRHDPAIAADVAAADAAAVEGTPAFLINDYYLFGGQRLEVLRVVVERALSEAR